MSRTLVIGQTSACPQPNAQAKGLSPSARQGLAVQVLARTLPVAHLAQENQVSRKFLYGQAEKARLALEEAFAPTVPETQELFSLPVTKTWIRQLVLGLVLIGHGSIRGVVEILRDLFDLQISVGTVHNILQEAVLCAREVHAGEDLSGVRVGAHDEIFQNGQPVLVGADADSTYCYLLALAQARDATTWGVHLLDLQAKDLHPVSTVADFGRGLRAGQEDAWPGVPCFGDVFHASLDLGRLVHYLENRALSEMAAVQRLESKLKRARVGTRDEPLQTALAAGREKLERALALADDIAALEQWMREDVLALVAPDLQTRRALFDWVVEELRLREDQAPHRIAPIRRKLENHREELLGFAGVLEQQLQGLAQAFQVGASTLWEIYQMEGLAPEDGRRHRAEAALWHKLGARYYLIRQALQETLQETVRASSIVENLNSRLRCYFFLRRELGPDYLEMLRYFLNHRRFQRSERAERAGKSPIEILTGRAQPHWLETLGYRQFKRAG